MSARPAVAVLVCALLLPCLSLVPPPAAGGKAVLHEFSDGSSQAAVVFGEPGSNSSVTITLPKAADLTRATLDISGAPYLENWTIAADTREEFSAFTLSNLDINTSQGDVVLEKEFFGTDEFGNSSFDSRWSWLNSPSSWDLGSTRAGWLHMVAPRNTNFNGSRDSGALVYQSLRGNFTLETRVNCTPQWDWQKCGIMVRQDSDNWVALKYQNQSGKRVQWSVKNNGNMWNDISSGNLGASEVWLRLVREGSRWISLYSTNGASWTQLWDTNQGTAKTLNDPVRAGLLIADGGTWTYWPADFDYFNFSRYVSEGSFLTGALSTSKPVTQARATWNGPTSPINANSFLYVRTSAGSPWERLMPNATTKLIYPGSSPQLEFRMASSGIRTPDLFDLEVNLSALVYPAGLALGLGDDAAFWTNAGELTGTATADFRQALADHLALATPDGNGNVTVPLKLSCATRGVPTMLNLTVEYNLGSAPPAPALVSPGQGGFVTSQNPELWLNGTDPDADPLWYCVEVSGDGFVTRTTYNQTAQPVGWSRLGNPYKSGEEALLTVAIPLSQARTYAWRARSFDGAYWGPFSDQREFTVDITPPDGSVLLPGKYTGDNSTAGASFDFRDNESGVEQYEYMIGTRPEADNILASATTRNTTVAVRGLALQQGVNYYFSVRAKNRAGSWSVWQSSDAFQYWPDSVAPAGIVMARPLAGENVSGVIQIEGTAWLRDGWTRNHTVQYRLDDEPWKFLSPRGLNQTRDWSVERDTRALLDGQHTVQARLATGLINSTEIALAEAVITVKNTAGPPPLAATFSPPSDTPVTVNEDGRFQFGVSTTTQNLSIQWSVDGLARPGETYTVFEFHPNFAMAGRHTVSVSVASGGQTLERTWNVTVVNVDRPPVAGILNPPPGTRWQTGDNISFNASTSGDPDPEDALRYLWDLGDGTQLEGLEVVHAYRMAGTYKVILTVTDGTLAAQTWVNLTVTSPTREIQAGGPAEFPYLLVLGLAIAAAAAAGGGAVYLRRRGSDEEATKARPHVMYRLPAPNLVDEDEELPRARETSADDWKRLERDAAQTPPSLALSYPEYRPSSEGAAARQPPAGQAHATFTPPAETRAAAIQSSRPGPAPAPQYQPRPQYYQAARPGPAFGPEQTTVQPPVDTSFEDIPEVEVMPEEVIPEAPVEVVPAAPAQMYRPVQGRMAPAAQSRQPAPGPQPRQPASGARQPAAGPAQPGPLARAPPSRPGQKPADPMEELLALLEKSR